MVFVHTLIRNVFCKDIQKLNINYSLGSGVNVDLDAHYGDMLHIDITGPDITDMTILCISSYSAACSRHVMASYHLGRAIWASRAPCHQGMGRVGRR